MIFHTAFILFITGLPLTDANYCYCNICPFSRIICPQEFLQCFNSTINGTTVYGCIGQISPLKSYNCLTARCCSDGLLCNINLNESVSQTKLLSDLVRYDSGYVKIISINPLRYQISLSNVLNTVSEINIIRVIDMTGYVDKLINETYPFVLENNELYKISIVPIINGHKFVQLGRVIFMTQLYNYEPDWLLGGITLQPNKKLALVCVQCMKIYGRDLCRDCTVLSSLNDSYIYET